MAGYTSKCFTRPQTVTLPSTNRARRTATTLIKTNRLQSVLNAAARSIAGLRRSDHITDTLASFHWLKVPERIQFKLATIDYRSLNGTAPRYLAADLRRLSDMLSRRRLRSSLTDQLDVRQSQCSTVGDRTFAVAGARLWNSLPHDIVVDSKHFYLHSHILLFCFSCLPCGPCGFYLGHVKKFLCNVV